MYIKKVIIQGFRSYRDQTCPGEFDAHHNIIVGRNGSGKSNFFQAIQFVLSDEYSHLSPQERINLLHEGTGPRVVSAYVEIIFDNSDNRIPFDKTEVSLRRIIGNKKDQYFLDKKMVTKTDVMNLLESAGFSRSNPYYIVKQGKITQLATAPDHQRLKLLREVAGTRVYDERKEESKQIFKESEAKMDQINELLSSIDERLRTLESETKELKEYQKCDRDRRSLEFTIFDRELKDIKRKLDEIKDRREQSSVNTLDMRRAAKKCADDIEKLEREYRDLRLKEGQMIDEVEQIQAVLSEKLQRREQLQLLVNDYKTTKRGGANARARAQKDLVRVMQKISQVQARLEEIKPLYERARSKEDEMGNSLSDAEHRRKELFAKQGRVNQFQSRTQRDEWIKEQMKSLNKAIKDKENTIRKLSDEIDSDIKRIDDLVRELEGAERSMEGVRQELEAVSEELRRLRREKDEVQADRQTVYRQESKVQQQLNNLRDELNRTEHNLRSITGKSILNGLDSVRRVIEIFREKYGSDCHVVQGYYGTLIELINCPDTFYTSVEVTAGTRLFYHVVENEELVIKILQEVNKHNLPGEINFFPINRLHARESVYPETNDAIPMMSRLTFDPKFQNVMLHNFGKTLVCRSIEIATTLAKNLNFDCVTLDGDQVSRRGTLTGGYYDQRFSRLELQKRKQKMEMEIQETENVQQNYITRKEALDSRINEIIDKLQRKETVRAKHEMTFDKLKKDIYLWKEEQHAKTEAKPQKEWKLTSLRHDLEQMKYTRESYQVELGTDLLTQLSISEQREVDKLNENIQGLTIKAKEAYSERMHLEAEKTENENLLDHNLMRKKDQLEAEMTEVSETDITERLQEAEDELRAIDERIEADQKQVNASEEKLAEVQEEKRRLEGLLENLRSQEKDYADSIQEDQQSLEKMQSKQSQLLKKKEETLRKIREIGSLPADALEKFNDKTVKQLYKLLDKANREIKRYSHVNKKALDQFVSYNEEKEKLLKRKEELDKGHQAIIDLMKALDHQKYEAIVLTFKQVSHYFQEIFKKLVVDGRAELIIRKGKHDDSLVDEDDDPTSSIPEVERFTGVGIEVSFTGGDAQMKDMNQLSGGQKSLVALTLIFAIQKCDPAPFYLFDEIDAALDPQYRKAVADMIKGLSKEAQFITTTFRPEMLEAAERFYGVKFRNKVSHIDQVTKEEALDFVEDDQTHG